MTKKVLLVATVQSHIAQFHRPLAGLLHDNGYEVHVAARNNLAEKNGLQIDFAEKIYNLPFARSPKSKDNYVAYKQLKHILDVGGYDIVHCNTPMGGIVARLAARAARKKGTKVTSERKFFPGYILVKMIMTDDAWHLIKNNPNVSNFLGSRNKPYPITEAEAQRIITQMQEGIERPQTVVEFEVGEQVRVCDGPFASFVGLIEEVDAEKARVKVSVSIFGRSTPVELEYNQVERI